MVLFARLTTGSGAGAEGVGGTEAATGRFCQDAKFAVSAST